MTGGHGRGALTWIALTSAVVSSLGILLVPTIGRQFHIPTGTAQWMLTVNLLVGAVATPVMGRLADGPRPRRLLMACLAVILVGSVVAGLAQSFAVFLIGRALQGLSYGIVPVTIAIARRRLPAAQVQPTIATLSITVATGLGVGYPLTGMLAATWGFRSAFVFGVVFLVSALLIAWLWVPGRVSPAPARTFDMAGALLLGTGLSALLLTIAEGGQWGWGSPATLGVVALCLAAFVGWVLVELRHRHPW